MDAEWLESICRKGPEAPGGQKIMSQMCVVTATKANHIPKDATRSGWEIIHLYAALSPILGSPVHNKYHQTGDKTTEMDWGWSI